MSDAKQITISAATAHRLDRIRLRLIEAGTQGLLWRSDVAAHLILHPPDLPMVEQSPRDYERGASVRLPLEMLLRLNILARRLNARRRAGARPFTPSSAIAHVAWAYPIPEEIR